MKSTIKPQPSIVLAATMLASAALTAGEKPNIMLFLVDDMGWQDTSVPFHTSVTPANKKFRTPNMEKLASEGLLFTNAYACAICSPTRISLMTGMNAARHGVTCWTLRKDTSPESKHKNLLPAEWPLNGLQPVGSNVKRSYTSVTLPERLKEAGYVTIHAGKGHFGAKDTPGADPSNLGFDVNIAGSYMGGPGSFHGDKNFSASFRNGGKIWDVPGLEKYHGHKINLTEAITREAVMAVETCVKKKKPFYLYMSHYAVHAPWEPDRRFIGNYSNQKGWSKNQKIYASMVESMDRSLGDLRAAFKRLKIEDNTIVIFMSDNGSVIKNTPLRGGKISAYEGGSRVPMIAHWPGQTPASKRTDNPVIIEDFFPTILEFAGLKPKRDIDGKSFVSILKKPSVKQPDRALFWHYPNIYYRPPFSAVRRGNYKLIYQHATQKFELYDLSEDFTEKTNIAGQMPELTNELAKILSDHLRETKAYQLIQKASKKPVPLPDEKITRLP